MLDNFSKEIIYVKMLPPYTQTLFVELVKFAPGQPDGLYTNGHAQRASNHHLVAHHPAPVAAHSQRRHPMPIPNTMNNFITDRPPSLPSQHVPPPPPWSRWSTQTMPFTQSIPGRSSSSASRKRKAPDATPGNGALESASSSKRPRPQTPPSVPGPSQLVSSPSLAKVLGPTGNQSPRPVAPASSSSRPIANHPVPSHSPIHNSPSHRPSQPRSIIQAVASRPAMTQPTVNQAAYIKPPPIQSAPMHPSPMQPGPSHSNTNQPITSSISPGVIGGPMLSTSSPSLTSTPIRSVKLLVKEPSQ